MTTIPTPPSPLRVDNLAMVRGTKVVVHGIKFELQRGRITALMGPTVQARPARCWACRA